MLSRKEARTIAELTIARLTEKWTREYAVVESAVVEKPFTWVFPFNTRKYLETGDLNEMSIGLGPVVVNRKSGAAVVAPPMPIGRYLAQYEAQLNLDGQDD